MFTFGSDPEFILKKDGVMVPAVAVLPSQKNAHKYQGSCFYHDNALAEIAVKPANCEEEAVSNIMGAIGELSRLTSPGSVHALASGVYPDTILDDPLCREVGCDPESCAYTMRLITDNHAAYDAIINTSHRTAGGHIHLGQYSGPLVEDGPEPIFLVYLLDLFLGIPDVFLNKDPSQKDRRKLYGAAGRFRKKYYGVEYRTLSNYWLRNEFLIRWVYSTCEYLVENLENQNLVTVDEELWESELYDSLGDIYKLSCVSKRAVQDAINGCDKKLARSIWKHMIENGFVPSHLSDQVESLSRLSFPEELSQSI